MQAVAVSLPALYQLASFISLFIYLFLCVGEANKIKNKNNCDSANDFPLTLGFNALYDCDCYFHFAK